MKTNKLIQFWSILLVFLTVLGVGDAWGTDWSYTFSSTPTWSPASGTTRSMTINSATWSVSTSNEGGSPSTWGTYGNSNSSGGIKFGDSGTNYYGTTTLSTDYFSGSLVSSVTVNLLINGSKTTTITVTQGVTIGSPSYGTGATWYNFTANTNTGTSGTLTLQITTTQAIYIHSIAVTYTAATPRTVTFNKQGGTFDDSSFDSDNTLTESKGGAGVTLPAVSPSSACASEGWGFYGWATSAVGSSTTTAPTIVGKAGDTYHPTSDVTLHAVFAQGEYMKETSSITSGAKYLIVANSTKNYVMTDSYSLNGSGRGEMKSAQIDETSSGKYSAASVNAQWCYTIEASSTQYYIRDVKNSSSSNYVDIAYLDWYKQSVDASDKYDFTLSAGKWKIENDYSYFYFNSTDHVFTNDGSNYTQFLLYKAGTINYYSTPSCCDKAVAVSYNSGGSSNVSAMTFSETSLATCSSTAGDREVTVTVTPSTGYFFKSGDRLTWTKSSGTIPSDPTYVSGPTLSAGKYNFVYRFAQNDNGAGTFAATASTYTNYKTKCCTALSDIGGSVKSRTATSITLQWTKLSNVDGTTPYEVTVFGDEGTVGDIDLTGSKAECTISDLDPCTDYLFTIKAYGASGYCDREEDVEGTTKGAYTYTITKTNVSLKGGETEAADNCSDFVAEYVASDGYALPATITVTGASDYTWEDGVLGIDKADVTGNVTVSIEGVAKWYYSGDDDSWDKTSMTLSTGGTYFYIQSSTDDHQFKIRKGSDWFGDNYLKPGFAMTNITALSDYSDGACDDCNCYCTYNNGSYYIIVFLGNTFLNNASTPVICASTTLPDDSPSGLAETKKIYLTPNSSWLSNGAKFAVNYYAHGTAGWSDYMTQSPCDEDVWEVEIPKLYSDIIITRMNPSGSIAWGNPANCWNQTGDLRIPAGKNRFTLPASGDYEWNGATTTWSAYTPDTYTISFDKGTGTSGSMSSLSSIACDASQDLTANTFEKTGYSFSHWTANADVTVDDATVDAGDPIDDEETIQNIREDIALTAQWTANKYDVTLKPNSGSGSDQTVQATYGSGMPLTVKTAGTAIVVPTRTGYDFNGYWDDASSGTQYYTYTGSPKALGSARNWDKAAATNLYAHWTAKQTTVSFNQNSGSGGQTTSKTATYDQAMPTPITLPTREGHTFGGYYESSGGTGKQYYTNAGASANNWDKTDATWTLYAKWTVNNYTLTWSWGGGSTSSTTHTTAGSVAYGTALVYPANNTMSKTGYSFTGWSSTPSTMPASATTITAQWSINDYNVAVLEPNGVTITATPYGGDAIAEGNNDDAEYNSTVTLNYSSLGSGLTWGGWRVTKADDASVSVSVSGTGNGATFTMPAYAVKVTAIVYSVGIAWCDPDVVVTGDVHVTSYNGISVNTTSGAGNLIEISSSDMGSATKMEIGYLDGNDDEIADKDESVFRFCNNGTTNYNVADEDAIGLDYEWRTTHSMRYTPNDFNQYDNYKLQLTFKRGDKVLKTVTHAIFGRSLPEEFVIASKYLGHWYALPNTMGTATEAVTPILITVDDADTPTEASYAPSTTVYKGTARKRPGSNVNSIRLTNDDSHWLITNNSNAQMGLSATETEGYENREVWYLKSSDFGAYELAMDPAQSPSKKLGMYSGNMGMYADPAYTSEDIYLLPITNKYTPIDATATDWTGDAIGVTATTSATKMGIEQEDGTSTDAVTLSSSGTAHTASFDGDIDFTDLIGETILLTWYNGTSLVGGSQVVVPNIILAGSNDEWSDFASAPTLDDYVVLSKPMTIDVTDAQAKRIEIDKSGANTGALEINPGKELIVAEAVRKYDGTSFGGTAISDLYIGSNAANGNGALVAGSASDNTAAGVGLYTKARKDGGYVNQFIGVPLAEMTTYNGFYGMYVYGYDDANDAWKAVSNNGAMYPFTAYNLLRKDATATTLYMEGVLNLPGTSGTKVLSMGSRTGDHLFANSWTAPIDVKEIETTDFSNAEATIYIFNAGTQSDYTTNGGNYTTSKTNNPGQWLYMPVATVKASPSDFTLTVIPSMEAFMVKSTAASGSLTLDYKKHIYDPAVAGTAGVVANRAPSRHAADNGLTRIRLYVTGASGPADNLLMFEREDFSAGFDNGWEARKVMGSDFAPQMYATTDAGKMAINCVPNLEGTVIGFKAGTEDDNYTFTFDYAEEAEPLYLLDISTSAYTRVTKESSYSFFTPDKEEHNRFILTRNAPGIATGVGDGEWTNGEKANVQKIIMEDHVFILRGGQMYDVTGKKVQ